MTRKVYPTCQACQRRAPSQGAFCDECAENRREARSLLVRWPRIRDLTPLGIERVTGIRLRMPLSDSIRWLAPRELVAALRTS